MTEEQNSGFDFLNHEVTRFLTFLSDLQKPTSNPRQILGDGIYTIYCRKSRQGNSPLKYHHELTSEFVSMLMALRGLMTGFKISIFR
jgi:hypothetical protein